MRFRLGGAWSDGQVLVGQEIIMKLHASLAFELNKV